MHVGDDVGSLTFVGSDNANLIGKHTRLEKASDDLFDIRSFSPVNGVKELLDNLKKPSTELTYSRTKFRCSKSLLALDFDESTLASIRSAKGNQHSSSIVPEQ